MNTNDIKNLGREVATALAERLAESIPAHYLICLLRDPDWLDRHLVEAEAARFLKFEVSTLQTWRVRGGGPKFIRPSARCVRYRRSDLIAWQSNHCVNNTSQNNQDLDSKKDGAG